ncbi:tyrosine-type recombinase/integrase [Amphritea sp. HPY]|uniref:tyrosine-type recombinase/integrase n=1 Tax=Amphritea sp. HPY TaxID=3421652 RepID=UPI003D7DDB8F
MTHLRTPSYLLRRPSGFYFRYQIPARFRSAVGCNELQLPLHISDMHKAKHISTGMALTLKRTLETAMGTQFTKADLKRIAQHWKTRHLMSMEEDKATASVITLSAHEEQLTSIELLLSDLRERFALNNYADLTEEAAELLSKESHAPTDVQQLAYELAKARIEAIEHQTQLYKGKIPTSNTTSTAGVDDDAYCDALMSTTFETYASEKLLNKDWVEKTQHEHRYALKLLIGFIGDKSVSTISKADILKVKETLARLPKNITKDKRFTGLGIQEIVDSGISDNYISPTSIKKYLNLISSFLDWCQRNGFIAENPAKGMIPKRKHNTRDERSPLNDADVTSILKHSQINKLSAKKPHQFWLPRLGMYTGARLEELCQLHTGDIKEVEGIHFIDINASRPDQHLKNQQSPRVIPLHPHLIEAGFIDYLTKADQQAPDGLIFPELYKTDGKYSHNVSKWFSRAKKKAGVEDGKTFHSYRHTMADKLRGLSTEDYVIKRIMGHATQSETHDRYGSTDIKLLAKAINQVAF